MSNGNMDVIFRNEVNHDFINKIYIVYLITWCSMRYEIK